MKFQKWLERIFPRYSWIPLICVAAMNFITYSVTLVLVSDERRHYIHMEIDDLIPFIPAFVFFYVASFVQWGLNWFFTAREGQQFCYRFAKADLIAKIPCLIMFIAYPTIIQKPTLEVTDFFSFVMNTVWFFDKPVNCLPSVHALASWIAVRAMFQMKKPAKIWRVLAVVFCAGCFAAVVFTKQHYLIDIPAGVLAAEIGLAVSKRLDDERFLWLRAG